MLALFVIFVVPETRRVLLEEMDVLFGGVNHVEKGGAQLGVEDPHHANPEDIVRSQEDSEKIAPVTPVAQHFELKI